MGWSGVAGGVTVQRTCGNNSGRAAPEAHLASTMAKAYCSDAFREVAGEGIQIHGGIGFTWEHDMHIYFKRAKSSEVAFGDGVWNRERVARVILPEAGSGDFDE